MNIKLTVTPQLSNLDRSIGQLSESLMDGFDWASLAPTVAEAADRIFASEGRGGWPQLSEAYARWKSKHYPGKGILELTGAYRRAATQVGAPHNVVEVGDDHLTYGVEGFDPNYPLFHEAPREGSRLPARPVFELLAEDEELSRDVADALSEHINQKLNEAQIAR